MQRPIGVTIPATLALIGGDFALLGFYPLFVDGMSAILGWNTGGVFTMAAYANRNGGAAWM